jgi:DNA mismatch repair ATPase MutS
MRVTDDLVHGKSRYLAEAERLLTLVRQVGSGPAALCLVDELLSGTNAAERLAASTAILEHLERAGAVVVTATHDLELAEQLRSTYDAYSFADDFSGDDLRFDHHIRPGLATGRNAIQLLERLGYPAELVGRARQRLEPS